MPKEASIFGLGLSAIPMLGGSLSGHFDPVNGLSPRESAYALDPFSIGGSVAGPLGMMLAKNPMPALRSFFGEAIRTRSFPTSKLGLKKFFAKALLASAAGSAIGTAAGRIEQDRMFGKKAWEWSDVGDAAKSVVNGAGAVAKAAPGIIYDWTIGSGVDAVRDIGSAGKMLFQGDLAGAGARSMSALGNAALFGTNFLGPLAWGGRLGGAALKGIGRGVKGLQAAKAISVGDKIVDTGKAVRVAAGMPRHVVKNNALGYITGHRQILKTTPAKTWGGKALNLGKGIVNNAAPIGGGIGLSVGGELAYANTRGGKMEQMLDSSLLPKYIGDTLPEQIKNLSRAEQLKVYDRLEEMGVPGNVLGDWAQAKPAVTPTPPIG